MGTGIKQVKDGCWTFAGGDKFCYPYPGGAGANATVFTSGPDDIFTCNKTFEECVKDFDAGNQNVYYQGGPGIAQGLCVRCVKFTGTNSALVYTILITNVIQYLVYNSDGSIILTGELS